MMVSVISALEWMVKEMPKGIAVVSLRVSTDPQYCEYVAPEDTNGWRSVCSFMKIRDRHGRGGRIDRRLPKCSLFGEWLESNGYNHIRCDKCKIACGEMDGEAE